jgi:hypothetical protein
MTNSQRKRRWCHVLEQGPFIGLPVATLFLLISERFQLFAFNERKGWTVLITVGISCVAILLMLSWSVVALFVHRRFQFSVRSLLWLFTAIGVTLGWLAWDVQLARRQREAVVRLTKLDILLGYDYQLAQPTIPEMNAAVAPAPEWLRNLLGRDFFGDVVWFGVHWGTPVFGDAELKHVQGLTKLKELSLSRSQITDNGLRLLKPLAQLEHLRLDHTEITDAGLSHLAKMSNLEHLCLHDTQITDAGLMHLAELTNLKTVTFSRTRVTNEGVARLQEALPNCEIVYNIES